jgi:hypothetical protein
MTREPVHPDTRVPEKEHESAPSVGETDAGIDEKALG